MGELLNSSLFFQKSPISFEQTESTNSIAVHMPPEDMISQKVVTIKTVCNIKAFRILGVKLHNFQNTFHQLFWRYGNPDMHFLGTLKIEFLILDV